jgi:hypothetical protein
MALLLTRCAELDCPPGQEVGVEFCVCSNTLEPAVDGVCMPDVCDPDGCPCTLEGINLAIARGGTQVLNCGPNSPPVATTDTIVVDNDVVLDGQGNLTVRGDGNHRILDVQAVEATLIGFTIINGDQGVRVAEGANLTLTNCDVSGNESRASAGGGIFNDGALTLVHSLVHDNVAAVGSGGGIYNSGTLALSDGSSVTDNEARTGPGGGIRNDGGTVQIDGSEVSRNKATQTRCVIFDPNGAEPCAQGGGIANYEGTVTVTDSSIVANEAYRNGGGLANEGANGKIFIVGSTVSQNVTMDSAPDPEGGGGGLWAKEGQIEATQSTWSKNTAADAGGAFFLAKPPEIATTLILRSSTVSANVASGAGGGLRLRTGAFAEIVSSTFYGNDSTQGSSDGIQVSGDSSAVLQSSTISNNGDRDVTVFGSLTVSETIIDGVCFIGTGAAVIMSEGRNIESPGDTCTFDDGNDTVNVTSEELSLAEELADNGGPTLTLIPAITSLAVDYLDDPGLCGTSEDQRGELRPQNFVCDVGAVEVVH